jgi:hypothetical protein
MANAYGDYNGDCTVSLLYNMLRLYYTKLYLESKNATKIMPKDIWYKDGHVTANMSHAFGNFEEYDVAEFDVGEAPDVQNGIVWKEDMEIEEAVYLNFASLSSHGLSAIKCGAAEFEECDAPFSLHHASPKLTDHIYGIGGKYNATPNYEFKQLRASDFKTAIDFLVKNNRLHAHFDIAYGMLCQVMYHVKPRSLEALIWHTLPMTVKLPKLKCKRGMAGILTSGAPAVANVDKWHSYENWKQSPGRAIYHSVVLSEAVMVSMYEMVKEGLGDYDDWANTEHVGVVSVAECGMAHDFELARLRFGLDPYKHLGGDYGLVRGLSREALSNKYMRVLVNDPDAVSDYDLVRVDAVADDPDAGIEGSQEAFFIKFKQIAAPCFPTVSIGVNGKYALMNHKDIEFHAKVDEREKIVLDADNFTKMSVVLRAAGWDFKATRVYDGAVEKNWAANADGRYMPSYINSKHPDKALWVIECEDIKRRAESWLDIYDFVGNWSGRMTSDVLTYTVHFNNSKRQIAGAPHIMVSYKPESGVTRAVVSWTAMYEGVELAPVAPVEHYVNFMKTWDTGELTEGQLIGS